jgi:sec-independent protein translocase protein TatA
MFGSMSLVHWIIVLGIVLLVFGAGRLPNVMGDFAKGIKAFKAGMKDDDAEPPAPIARSAPPSPPAQPVAEQPHSV